MRWVGIDEAGYGPYLGPLVLTAVVAEGPGLEPPDLWADLGTAVCRAGVDRSRLWVDDSKRLYSPAAGSQRLEAASLALLDAIDRPLPSCLKGWFRSFDAGTLDEVELRPWLDGLYPLFGPRAQSWDSLSCRPLVGTIWRLVAARSVVVGPSRFNRGLAETGSKAPVHFAAFAELLRWVWDLAADGVETLVRSDKHGGRHYYLDLLHGAFPGTWIDRGVEGPARSGYTLREPGRRLELELKPRADSDDGLVALASIVSKALRERWMHAFNAFWTSRIPGLEPSAGYPGDADRFRRAIEPHCRRLGLDPSLWWRLK